MQPARLLPQPGEKRGAEIVERTLLVFVSTEDNETGIVARQGLVRERVLTSIQEEEEDFDLTPLWGAKPWLTRANPFLTPQEKDQLDEGGVRPVGALLRAGEVLISALREALPRSDRPAQPGKCWIRDDSWHVLPDWDGAVVTNVQIYGPEPRAGDGVLVQRLRIAVHAEHELAAGDVLLYRDEPVGVIARLVVDEEMPSHEGKRVDLLLPCSVGQQLGVQAGSGRLLSVGKALEPAAHSVQARSIGLYSLISKEPLSKPPRPGLPIRANQVRWLQSRGFTANLAELTSLKSDDLGSRGVLKELIASKRLLGESIPEPGAPESLLILQHYLRSLGLEVKVDKAEHGVSLSIRPAAADDILSWSSGQVHKTETIHYRNLEEVEGGLFCPRIFGSPRYSRRRRFGHIVLPAPVVSPLWLLGTPSPLKILLGMPNATIKRILQNKAWTRRVQDKWEILDGQPDSPTGSGFLTGALAIEAMLKTVPRSTLPPGLLGRPEVLAPRLVPMVPPEVRPLVLLDSGTFATADINDLYRQLVNRANRLVKLEQLCAPSVILDHERRELQKGYAALQANCLLAKSQAVFREEDPDDRLVDCLELVFRHLRRPDGKRVEWCGKARAVASSEVPGNTVQIPQSIFNTLLLDPETPVLLTVPDSTEGTFVALLPRPRKEAVLRLPPWPFTRLGLNGLAPVCIVHRPLGAMACAEARSLLHEDPGPVRSIPQNDSWTKATDLAGFASKLAQAALFGNAGLLQSPEGLLVGGTGQFAFAEDAQLPGSEENVQEIDKPTE